MSSERKSIVIDSASLTGGGGGSGGTSKRRSQRSSGGDRNERRIRPSSIVQPSTLKKTLLERIKQHQRKREQTRKQDNDNDEHSSLSGGSSGGSDGGNGGNGSSSSGNTPRDAPPVKGYDNFNQSMDFLRKLALKRRQQTQKQPRSSYDKGATPESKMLNQVSETLKNGEIITNTGLLGLPVVPTMISSSSPNITAPIAHLGEMPMMAGSVVGGVASYAPAPAPSPAPTSITDLGDLYNNTIASAPASTPAAPAVSDTASSPSTDPPLHIPQNPEDFLPSIFIKQDPPHGCLKNGNKPTFREWATKMLNKPVDAIKNMIGGGGELSTEVADMPTQNGGEGIQNNQGLAKEASAVHIDPSQIAGMRVKIRKTKKKSFRIGKHDDVVGVLLKNKQTQRHIQNQHLTLKQKTIGEIRKYLYDHQLLKIGSNAPPDVLRRMYEDAILTGEVKNTNNDVLLHNFMSGGGGE
jgi:hypothetical protein